MIGYTHLKIDVSISFLAKEGDAFWVGFDIDSMPSATIKQTGIGKSTGVMCPDIDKEPLGFFREHPVQDHVLAFLGIGLHGIGIEKQFAKAPERFNKPRWNHLLDVIHVIVPVCKISQNSYRVILPIKWIRH